MRLVIRDGLRVALAAGMIACSEQHPAALKDSTVDIAPAPAGMIVSDASLGSSSIFSASTSPSVAYVSVTPGTFPRAVSASVSNKTRSVPSITVQVKEGGFDPVAIDAEPDDELLLTIVDQDGSSASFVVKVPRRRPPEIVRTVPARGRTDVALNVQIQVIFTEPIENSDRTRAAFRLRSGENQIDGSAQLTVDGLSAIFTPARDLAPLTSYTLSITPDVRDQDGEVLSEGSSVTFTTAEKDSPGSDPPGDVIAFTRFGDNGGIYRVNLDGTGLVNLSNHPKLDMDPAWSPDGKRIAFISSREPGSRIMYHWNVPAQGDIYVMNADGSNVIRLTMSGGIHGPPAWSPDGRKLAFADNTGAYVEPSGAYNDVAIIEVAIGEPSRRYLGVRRTPDPENWLDDGGMTPIDVSWSPDGRSIVFSNWSAFDSTDIYVVGVDGWNLRRILSGSDAFTGLGWTVTSFDNPSWSPDGTRIAFTACTSPWTACSQRSIAIANGDGHALEEVATDAMGGTIVGGVQWSPEGRSIVYASSDGIRYKHLDGSGGALVVPNGTSPAWRPSR